LYPSISFENTLVNPSPPLRKAQGRPIPPLEGEGNSLSLRERVRVRVGIFIPLCEPQGLVMVHSKIAFQIPPYPPFLKGGTCLSSLKEGGTLFFPLTRGILFPPLKKGD